MSFISCLVQGKSSDTLSVFCTALPLSLQLQYFFYSLDSCLKTHLLILSLITHKMSSFSLTENLTCR